MPKRSNEFQDFITLIERTLAPTGASVIPSAMLTDRATGGEREVDIAITHLVGNHEVVIAVECTAIARKADVHWVDQMIGTHSSLPTNKLILVSKSGFTAEARAKAKSQGVGALSLDEAKEEDWAAAVRNTNEIKVVATILPYLTKATVILEEEAKAHLNATAEIKIDQARLVPAESDEAGDTVKTVVDRWLLDPNVLQVVQDKAFLNEGTILEFEVPMRTGVQIELPDGTRHPALAIRVTAKCRREATTIDLAQATYGDAAVAHGAGTTIGKPVEIVMVQKPGEGAAVAFRMRRVKRPPAR